MLLSESCNMAIMYEKITNMQKVYVSLVDNKSVKQRDSLLYTYIGVR